MVDSELEGDAPVQPGRLVLDSSNRTRRSRGYAVQFLAVEAKLVSGFGDLVVEDVQAVLGFGVGSLEAEGRDLLALQLGEVLLGLGQLGSNPDIAG